MRIIIDTKKERIIVPGSFFKEVDKINKDLAEGGSDKQWDHAEYVKFQFEKAIKHSLVRPSDKLEG